MVVCDGFIGNIVLKTCESLAMGIFTMLKARIDRQSASATRRLAGQNAFRAIKRRMDPEAYGGAPLLGLNGTVIKAHGSARERAIANAIGIMARNLQHHVNRNHCAAKSPRANRTPRQRLNERLRLTVIEA